jgi:Family of unknown function (DUF6325)
MATGPVQILVLDVGEAEPTGDVLAELERLAEHDIVRLLDLMIVRHHADGQLEAIEVSATPDGGATVAALTGLHGGENGGGPDAGSSEQEQDMWYVADAIPPGKTVAIALLEHRWAIGLRDALRGRGGELLAEAWVHPLDLVAIGLAEPEATAT